MNCLQWGKKALTHCVKNSKPIEVWNLFTVYFLIETLVKMNSSNPIHIEQNKVISLRIHSSKKCEISSEREKKLQNANNFWADPVNWSSNNTNFYFSYFAIYSLCIVCAQEHIASFKKKKFFSSPWWMSTKAKPIASFWCK